MLADVRECLNRPEGLASAVLNHTETSDIMHLWNEQGDTPEAYLANRVVCVIVEARTQCVYHVVG